MFRRFIIIWIVATSIGHAEEASCSKDGRVVSSCQNAHAQLMVFANLRPYLQLTGSTELLSIAFKNDDVDAPYYWPDNVDRLLTANNKISGDFRICPFTKASVCIDSAENIKLDEGS